jgi:biopolymer transport protein ExbD
MAGVSIPTAGSSRSGRKGGRARRHHQRAFGLQLTSLMDVLMIIVVFLLKSYGISSMGINQTDKLELPVSRAPETYGEGMALIIAKDKILLDSEDVMLFEGDPKAKKFQLPAGAVDTAQNASNKGIVPLFDALRKKKDDFDLLASRSPDPQAAMAKWKGELLVQADKAVPYEIIRRVMYTAGAAGYKNFRLTVEKQPE